MNPVDKLKILYKLAFDAGQPKIFTFHDCLPDVFSSYIELLIMKRFRILGAAELMEHLNMPKHFRAKESSGQKETVLTFDDGRRNCWTVIFPLLKKYKVKAVFFVIPGRIKDTDEYYPNLEDYWKGKVSWENLFSSHRRQPYLTWKEVETMQASGLVDIFSHSLKHEVAFSSSRVIDFQHPGVYEMPVYFDEWFQSGMPTLDSLWGAPVYERAWAPLISNIYVPNGKIDSAMNAFVKKNGGYLFFKKKEWRKKLFEYFHAQRRSFERGHFKKIGDKEEVRSSIFDSKKAIENRLKNKCLGFSLPLYQGNLKVFSMIEEAGYKAVFTGPQGIGGKPGKVLTLSRIPGFWIKFLSYF